ncbi:MAG TPA: LysR family transcriptional regulator [Vicinamibacterales bacterium]|nr:LysR family transcriptional regulator [Vicinamibacterales bacterium]
MDVDLDDYAAIVALADALHFGRAAERLHVSQPALSKRIRKVEAHVGGPLLLRRYRDVRLTEAGRLLAERGRQLLRESAATLAFSQRAARGETGRLRIGFGIASIIGLLPDVLLQFRRGHPDVQLELRDMSTPEQVAALAAGEIDVGFVRLPVTAERLVVRPVLDERLVAALGPRTRWQPRAGLRSVAAEPFIIITRTRSASFYDHALSVCAAAGFTPRIVQEANELFTVLSLVGAGLGVSLVPRSAALMQLPGIRFRELTLPEAAWNIGVAWHRDAGTGPLVQHFVETVRRTQSAPRVSGRRTRSAAAR